MSLFGYFPMISCYGFQSIAITSLDQMNISASLVAFFYRATAPTAGGREVFIASYQIPASLAPRMSLLATVSIMSVFCRSLYCRVGTSLWPSPWARAQSWARTKFIYFPIKPRLKFQSSLRAFSPSRIGFTEPVKSLGCQPPPPKKKKNFTTRFKSKIVANSRTESQSR